MFGILLLHTVCSQSLVGVHFLHFFGLIAFSIHIFESHRSFSPHLDALFEILISQLASYL